MSITIVYSAFLVLFLIILIKKDFKKNHTYDSPGVFVGLLWLAMNIFTLHTIATDVHYFDIISSVIKTKSISEVYLKYVLVQIVFFFFLYQGIWSINPPIIKRTFKDISNNVNIGMIKSVLAVCIFFFSLGIYMLWTTNGGLAGILLQFGDRSQMNNDNILIQIGLASPYILITTLFIIYQRGPQKILHKCFLLFIILFVIGGLALTGGRKPYMLIFYYLFFFSIYGRKDIQIKKYLKYLLFLPLIFILFNISRTFRNAENAADFLQTGSLSDSSFSESSLEGKDDLSYIYIYTGIVNYFNTNNYYYGTSFIDLLYAYVPRKLMKEKPPVDDGMYIYTILADRKYVDHPAGLKKLGTTSWPPETLGNAYSNFGILGVILFAYLLGRIYSFFYYHLHTSKNNQLFFSIIYPFVLFSFHLSNLRIVTLITTTVTFFLFINIAKVIRKIAPLLFNNK